MEPYLHQEVQARQQLHAEIALRKCLTIGIDWLLHIDVDELFYCEGVRLSKVLLILIWVRGLSWDLVSFFFLFLSRFYPPPLNISLGRPFLFIQSLKEHLHFLSENSIGTFSYANYESVPQYADVGDYFVEVSLFKKNLSHVEFVTLEKNRLLPLYFLF
eukprot:TRINITY_DN1305_c0_g1_i11.p1 TRINITY_DN1305_c0_g1~~TRINITY_DN1305_c0_g1_i11.p1  ORF type:complete len:159 (+),score=27.32 TRINITY_DN1305_c0_g1_i11:474-950(+)